MNRRVALLPAMLAGVILVASACGGSGSAAKPGASNSGGQFTIGAEIDQSGASRTVGVPQLNGLQAAIQGANSRGGVDGHKIKLVVRNTDADPATGISVYRDLVNQQHVSAIAGLIASVVVPPLVPLAAKDKVALLATGAPVNLISASSPTLFSTVASLNGQGKAAIDLVANMAKSGKLPTPPRVALLDYSSPAGQDWEKAVSSYAEQKNVQIVEKQNSAVGAGRFTSQMQAITGKHPDAIVAFDIQSDIVAAAKAGKAIGLDPKTLITDYNFASNPAAIQQMAQLGFKNFVASANFAVPTGSASDSEGAKQFAADAKAANVDPGAVQVPEGYAQGRIMIETLQKCGYPCPAAKFLSTLLTFNSDLNGLAFGPVKYSEQFHQGVTAVRFRTFDPGTGGVTYSGAPVQLAASGGGS